MSPGNRSITFVGALCALLVSFAGCRSDDAPDARVHLIDASLYDAPPPPFNVTGAASTGHTKMTVTFNGAPDPTAATTLGNYSVSGGLTLSGTPTLAGSTVTFTTSAQTATSYTVTVTGVTRASDSTALTTNTATFTGRTAFNVSAAAAVTNSKITVTFDAAPNPAQAVVPGNYALSGGLTVVGTPQLTGSTVTVTTSSQTATGYTVTVTGVTRGTDGEPLATNMQPFTGRTAFNVTNAASTNNVTVVVTFSDPPSGTSGAVAGNYTFNPALSVSTAVVSGSTVTLTTESQAGASYLLTVSSANVMRASDGEPLNTNTFTFDGTSTFNVVSAQSTSNSSMSITFDAAPNATQAVVPGNYTFSGGLTVQGVPTVNGNTVTVGTSGQTGGTMYTATVLNVTRNADAMPLVTNTAMFTGRTSFNVASAVSTGNESITVTFDAPPNGAQAVVPGNYVISGGAGLTIVGTPTLNGSTVTLGTSAQLAQGYTVTVTGVTRAADTEPLLGNSTGFTGVITFSVRSAASASSATMTVIFDAAPNAAQASTLGNYSVPGLTLSGVPAVNGNVVTINTSAQSGIMYTVTVSTVTRNNDGTALTTATADFDGTATVAPTVTNVVVASTLPDNGTIPYNTGTTTLTITGTDFLSVVCPAGVKLNDLDGNAAAVSTVATSCTVDSNTQITATFPAGIRTNGTAGWSVLVTNIIGANTTSAVTFQPQAGLLISEIYQGTSGTGNAHREFVEVYNPTANTIDTVAIGLRYHLHSSATNDVVKALTLVAGKDGKIPSHGFLLIMSSESTNTDMWFSHGDYTYDSSTQQTLVANGGVYLSLSDTTHAKPIDRVGWGTQPTVFEGTRAPDISLDNSIQRKPAGGAGHATDTDNNANDFTAQSTTITPRGTADAAQP